MEWLDTQTKSLKPHGGKYVCGYCEGPCNFDCGILRTYGGMKKRYEQFIASGGNLRDAQKYANQIHAPLIDGDDSAKILDDFPLPELHMLIGGVNVKLNLLIKIYGRERVEEWLRQIGVIRHVPFFLPLKPLQLVCFLHNG